MSKQLIITVFADDRPGIIREISNTILEHSGNWLDSSLSQLAGKFTGIILISVAEKNASALQQALQETTAEDLDIRTQLIDKPAGTEKKERALINLVGNDRPGIVDEIATLLADNQINVVKLVSSADESPMSSGLLFTANLEVELDQSVKFSELQQKLESLSAELMVEISAG